MTQEEIEYYHNIGKMPDWVYYQINGKSPQQNYVEQRKKILDRIDINKSTKVLENQLEDCITANLEELLSKIIQNININL